MSILGLQLGFGASTSELFTYHFPLKVFWLHYDYIFGQEHCSRISKICWTRDTSNSAKSGHAAL